MLNKCRTIIVLVSLLFCIVVLTACGDDTNGDVQIISEASPNPKVTATEGDQIEKTKNPTKEQSDKEGKDSYRNVLKNTKQLPIYCINEDGTDIEPVDIFIDEKADVDAALVIDEVVSEYSDHNITIGIDHVKQDDKESVFVSFKKHTAPVTGVEEEIESMILDSISQSILDNVEDCRAVIFQVEGNAYQSEHISFKENEAYDWK